MECTVAMSTVPYLLMFQCMHFFVVGVVGLQVSIVGGVIMHAVTLLLYKSLCIWSYTSRDKSLRLMKTWELSPIQKK